MESIEKLLKKDKTLEVFYSKTYKAQEESTILSSDAFNSYTHKHLMEPAKWFNALALCELAIHTEFDTKLTEAFLQRLFRGYDFRASVLLNDEDYAFYWKKINQLFEDFAPRSTEAIVEQALQFYLPRSEYVDQSKTLQLLQKAAELNCDTGKAIWEIGRAHV